MQNLQLAQYSVADFRLDFKMNGLINRHVMLKSIFRPLCIGSASKDNGCLVSS